MRISLIAVALILSACRGPLSGNENAPIEPFNCGNEVQVANRAKCVSERTLKGISSHEHYLVEAQFLGDEAHVSVYSHFNSFAYVDGVKLEFDREGDHIHLSVSTPQNTPFARELPAQFLDATGRFRVHIEVQNTGSNGVRVLLWNDNISYQGEVQNHRPYIAAGNADLDSKSLGWIFQSRGTGVRWGLDYQNARILVAHRQAPYAN